MNFWLAVSVAEAADPVKVTAIMPNSIFLIMACLAWLINGLPPEIGGIHAMERHGEALVPVLTHICSQQIVPRGTCLPLFTNTIIRRRDLRPSSSGLGRRPFTAETRVRFP